jgi:hypothetical protein
MVTVPKLKNRLKFGENGRSKHDEVRLSTVMITVTTVIGLCRSLEYSLPNSLGRY